MRRYPIIRRAGFTIVELIIALSLSTVVMIGVLSVYIFVARSYTRTIGFGLPSEPTLESQGRRTLSTLARDVQMTSAITFPSGTLPVYGRPLSATSFDLEFTLTLPRSTGGTENVTYYYNSTNASVVVYTGVSVPAKSLSRINRTTNTVLTLHTSLLSCIFYFYDASGRIYPLDGYNHLSATNYLVGIKQLSFVLTSQTGNSANNTLTRVYQVASPRLIFRNKSLLL